MKLSTSLLIPLQAFVGLAIMTPLPGPAQVPDPRQGDPATVSFRQRIALVQADDESQFGGMKIEHLEQQVKRKLTDEERAVFETTDAGKWKRFEDDVLQFDHPDHTLFSVNVLNQENRDSIRVVGGVASMADNSFQRAYHLKIGDLYYGVILVREAGWFDEGICLCGPIVFKKCLLADGTALEFSLLPSGDIKKVQALGARHRAILFEWTHSVIPQSAYARLGRSLRFKDASKRTEAEWHALSRKERGVEGLVSWLEREESAAKVRALLGKPDREEGGLLQYVSDQWYPKGSGSRTTVRLKLNEGVLAKLEPGWSKWEDLPPKKGTVAWAEKRIEHWQDDQRTPAEKDTAMKPELRDILDLFFEKGARASGSEWQRWSGIARGVTDLGLKDERLLTLIRERYSEKELCHFYSSEILEAFEVPDFQVLLKGRASYLLSQADPDFTGELNNLIAMLDGKDQSYAPTLQKLSAHNRPEVRRVAYIFADRLPRALGLEVLRRGLDDADRDARRMAALNIDEVATQADLEWLRQRMADEADGEVRDALKDAIEVAQKRQPDNVP